jgi:hypothetical protein
MSRSAQCVSEMIDEEFKERQFTPANHRQLFDFNIISLLPASWIVGEGCYVS